MISRCVVFSILLAFFFGKQSCFSTEQQEQHIIILDAGSTGSRIYIYKFDVKFPLETITEVAHKRVNPALSTFVNNSIGLTLQINTLLAFAKTITPPSSWASTNISLKATAGLRSLSDKDVDYLITATNAALKDSVFLADPQSTKVISGEEEALFDILAVTALFQSYKTGFTSMGAADMGGSSQQMAFTFTKKESDVKEKKNWISSPNVTQSVDVNQQGNSLQFEYTPDPSTSIGCRPDWRIKVPGTDQTLEIFAKSLEYMGLIAAMDTVLDSFYSNPLHINSSHHNNDRINDSQRCVKSDNEVVGLPSPHIESSIPSVDCQQLLHPCLPDGIFPEVPGFTSHPQPLYGSGDFEKCHQLLQDIFVPNVQRNIDLDCIKERRPKVMVGMDNFPKVLEILGIPQGVYVAPAEIKRRAIIVCNTPWEELLAKFPGFMPYRAQRACFGATYVYSMLVDVYGIEEDDGEAFLPIDTVVEKELSWALGAAVFYALGLEYDSMKEIQSE
jgi:hypothetical protein